MSQSSRVRFGEFELDEDNASLTRAGVSIALPPKAFALLCLLARQPGRLADKNALLDAIWGHRFVSDSVLKTTISQVRAALADDPGTPRYIETVSRRGYRFIGRLEVGGGAGPARPAQPALVRATGTPQSSSSTNVPPMIGRGDALARLQANWQRAIDGQRQLVWLAGEAGIGKTTLVERFIANIGPQFVAHGQCVEQFGAGEPYLPIFEALKNLCRRDAGVAPALRRVAPTWLAQMPWLVPEQDRAGLQLDLAGAGQERMLRELIDLGDVYGQQVPLLMVTEDLHWADDATLRLMEYFARRRPQIRVMWLATFRLTQAIAEDHPLIALRQELQLHQLSDEILLEPFSEQEVADYVRARVPDTVVPEESIRRLHAHTDGLPLFVANVLDGLIPPDADRAAADAGAALLKKTLPVPNNLTGAIERQLTKVPADALAMLEAASVCGMEFSARRVARLVDGDAIEVGRCMDDLVRRKYWLADAGIVDLPDGSIDPRYVFRHALYKHALYQRMPQARRVTYHRDIARATGPGDAQELTAAERASHLELGRDHRAAVAQYVEAAKSALGRFAPRDAIEVTSHALTLLLHCPDGPERLELELGLLAHRGIACAHVFGVSSPESVAAFKRVREICDALPQTPARALLLNGLAWGLFTRGEYAEAVALAQRVHGLAESTAEPTLEVHASGLLGVTYAVQGQHALSVQWFERGIAACERQGEALTRTLFLLDPEVSMRANAGGCLVMLGRADQARDHLRRSLERCSRIGQPIARLVALWGGCTIGVLLDDVDAVDRYSTDLGRLVEASGLRQGRGPSLWMRGWVEVRRGAHEAGYAHIMEGLASHEKLGMHGGLPIVLGFAAEALARAGRTQEAERKCVESLALVERIAERGMLTVLLTIRSNVAGACGDDAAAARYLDAALAEAEAQKAPGAELAVRVARARRSPDVAAELKALAVAYERVTEGRDAPLAARARELLASAPGGPAKPSRGRR